VQFVIFRDELPEVDPLAQEMRRLGEEEAKKNLSPPAPDPQEE
jgi:hypothetical protein